MWRKNAGQTKRRTGWEPQPRPAVVGRCDASRWLTQASRRCSFAAGSVGQNFNDWEPYEVGRNHA